MKSYLQKGLRQTMFVVNGEPFVNALHTTACIVIPVAACYFAGCVMCGIYISLGTLLIGLTDIPGNAYEKTRRLAAGSLMLALVSLGTALFAASPVLLGVLLTAFCFFFSMLSLYGGSISAIGSMSLIMMVFTMGLRPADHFSFSLCILAGGLWYTFGSVLYICLFPYRPARRALGECIIEIADFLREKACFYQLDVPLADCYKKVIAGHFRINEKQDAVRSMLLKKQALAGREILKARRHIELAAEVIDLYEQILAVHYDYDYIRRMLDGMNVLGLVNRLMLRLAGELHETGIDICQEISQSPRPLESINLLTRQIRNTAIGNTGLSAQLIDRIVANFEIIYTKINLIRQWNNPQAKIKSQISNADAIRFANDQPIHWKQFLQHLTSQSPTFRFAVRITFSCLTAYLVTLYLAPSRYSYWLLLTIIIVTRPSFSTTRKRNFQRMAGTLIGIAAAFIILIIIQQNMIQVALIILFLLGYINFLHINYLASVACITVVAIIGLHLLGGNNNDLLLQRGYETLFGGAAVLTATFLLPFWESRKLNEVIKQAIKADITYLEQLKILISQRSFDPVTYKLARKQVFVSSANLSGTYQRILAEKRLTVTGVEKLYQLQIFNHEFYASVASLFSNFNIALPDDIIYVNTIDQAISYLNDSLVSLNSTPGSRPFAPRYDEELKSIDGPLHKEMVSDQLQLILDLARNIYLQIASIAITK